MDELEQTTEVQEPPVEPEATVEATASAQELRGRSGFGFLLGFAIGAAIGAALAVLLAPQPGDEGQGEIAPASVDGALGLLRARLGEASAEARLAARGAEQAKRTRFEQLTRDGE